MTNLFLRKWAGHQEIWLKQVYFSLLVLIGSTTNVNSQDVDVRKIAQVDSLFGFIKPDQPGYIVGIIKDGTLIYQKGFGLANLSYRIPMSPESAFYMGSASKQFTAACLLWLVEQGKITINDNIQKYLPEMPSYGKPITLNHLLHHTSGIREYTSLMLMGGHDVNFEDIYTNNDAYYTAWHQKELNFQPGDKYLYSSGGYILLAKVIEKVTGKSLRHFADSVLFKPLGMSHTFFHDDHGDIITNRVESYYPIEMGYRQYVKTFDMVGDGGLITTLGDLAKWDAAFYQDRLGISHFAQKMSQRFTLTNGRMIPYTWGLNNDTYKGLRTLEHGGFMLGYDSDILRFPDQHFTVIVLNNARGRIWTTSLTYQIADIYLTDFFKKQPEPLSIRSARPPLTLSNVQQLTGAYWNVNENYFIQIDRSADTLIYNNTNGWTPRLIPLSNDTFQVTGTTFQVVFPAKGRLHFINPDAPYPV